MNSNNAYSLKFLCILTVFCILLAVSVWNACRYIPKNKTPNTTIVKIETNKENNQYSQKTNTESTENSSSTNNNEEAEYINEFKEKLKSLDFNIEENKNLNKNIQDTDNTEAKLIQESFEKAKTFTQNEDYASALSEYKKILGSTSDPEIKAECYEKIAVLYATLKRYGSALSAAQKAFNTSPTTKREVLLARVYYKTGDLDKATTRINNVLKRDFSINDK